MRRRLVPELLPDEAADELEGAVGFGDNGRPRLPDVPHPRPDLEADLDPGLARRSHEPLRVTAQHLVLASTDGFPHAIHANRQGFGADRIRGERKDASWVPTAQLEGVEAPSADFVRCAEAFDEIRIAAFGKINRGLGRWTASGQSGDHQQRSPAQGLSSFFVVLPGDEARTCYLLSDIT
jgi:hypothetical protein